MTYQQGVTQENAWLGTHRRVDVDIQGQALYRHRLEMSNCNLEDEDRTKQTCLFNASREAAKHFMALPGV